MAAPAAAVDLHPSDVLEQLLPAVLRIPEAQRLAAEPTAETIAALRACVDDWSNNAQPRAVLAEWREQDGAEPASVERMPQWPRLRAWLEVVAQRIFRRAKEDAPPLLRVSLSDELAARFVRMLADAAMPAMLNILQRQRYCVLLISRLLAGALHSEGVPGWNLRDLNVRDLAVPRLMWFALQPSVAGNAVPADATAPLMPVSSALTAMGGCRAAEIFCELWDLMGYSETEDLARVLESHSMWIGHCQGQLECGPKPYNAHSDVCSDVAEVAAFLVRIRQLFPDPAEPRTFYERILDMVGRWHVEPEYRDWTAEHWDWEFLDVMQLTFEPMGALQPPPPVTLAEVNAALAELEGGEAPPLPVAVVEFVLLPYVQPINHITEYVMLILTQRCA